MIACSVPYCSANLFTVFSVQYYKEGCLVTDEQVLITRAQRGDTDAFRELVERSKINVYRLAYDMTGSRHDAEDLSQEVFVKAYRALPKFRTESKWSTWLYRITTNVCIDHNRSRSKTMEYRDALTSDDATSEPNHPRSSSNPDRSTEASMIQRRSEERRVGKECRL